MKQGDASRQELDRRQWAQIQRIGFDLLMRGHGEHMMPEPIYFGRAFTKAPVFTYSMTTDQMDDAFTPFLFVPPRDLKSKIPDSDGLYPHGLQTNFVIQDPGFEHQGQWITYGVTDAEKISDVHIVRTGNLYSQTIRDNWTVSANGYRMPYDSNMWVQTADTNKRWIVSGDKAHDLGFGYAGKYSAKYVFDDQGSSNWLIPIAVMKGDTWGN